MVSRPRIKINKLRFKNVYFLVSLIALVLGLSICWFFESNFAEILFFLDYNAPDLAEVGKDVIQGQLLKAILNWEVFIDASMRYIIHLFPIFAVMPAVPFLFQRKSYFVLGANRFKNCTRSILKTILFYTISGGACISLGFVIYFSIGNIFMVPTLYDIGGFASIFPENFYYEHSYLFFIFMSTTIYFLIGCAFACMSCGIALFTDKEYFVLLIPVFVYIGLSYIGGGFKIHLLQISSCVSVFNSTHSTIESFFPLIPVFIFDFLLIGTGLYRRRYRSVL